MGKFSGVLLASDFDDTFLGRKGEVPQKNIEAVEYFKSQGGRFTIATGRSHMTFLPQLDKCPVNAPVVLSNGAMVYDFGIDSEIYRVELPVCAREHITILAETMPELGFEACHGEEVYVHNPNWVTRAHLEKVGTPHILSAIGDMPMPWIKVIIEQEHPILLQAQALMEERFGENYELVFSNKYLLEMTGKGCHKGSGVLKVANMLGISRENIFTVGDNSNDVPMFKISRMCFTPADSSDRIRGAGAQVVSSSDTHAVADAIEVIDTLY